MSGQDANIVALPHLLGARELLLRALESDPVERDLVVRAAAKVEDVRQLIDPSAGFRWGDVRPDDA